jgi:hypothetical protein
MDSLVVADQFTPRDKCMIALVASYFNPIFMVIGRFCSLDEYNTTMTSWAVEFKEVQRSAHQVDQFQRVFAKTVQTGAGQRNERCPTEEVHVGHNTVREGNF